MNQSRKIPSLVYVLIGLTLNLFTSALAHAQTIEVFAAGSLRAVVGDLSQVARSQFKFEVKQTFGGSGALRERIEKGEKPDLFFSADLASPEKLASQGRTLVPAIAFARNRMCIVSRRTAAVTPANLIDKLLASNVRVKTSTPVADPSGDYAWAIFDRIDAIKPGAGSILKGKAQAVMTVVAPPATASQSAAAALFASHQIDMSITYCSGAGALLKQLPELTSLEVPPRLDPHPVYGIAVLSAKPEALQLALYLLSGKGQEIIAKEGLVPILDAPAAIPK
jgi:ABC-type molybdate transport system substrate-binding protein